MLQVQQGKAAAMEHASTAEKQAITAVEQATTANNQALAARAEVQAGKREQQMLKNHLENVSVSPLTLQFFAFKSPTYLQHVCLQGL